ncbi:hypothetical protein Tco_1112265 [Tanacetum coccineum]|uniref:Uncharacterized protein n=1 Tax=Tanacetum coccineum TaxID=301880 RepID=A0ABQ5IP20_9ASTR
MPVKEAKKEDEAENEPNRKAGKEETTGGPSSQPVEYYLKYKINEKLIERLKKIRHIRAKSSQENAYSQFPIRRIHLLPYAVSMKITIQRYEDIIILGMYIILIINFARTPRDTPQYAVLA